MITLGLVLLIIGFVLKIGVLWSIGMILFLVGLIFWVLGSLGYAIGGRKHYY